MTAYVSHAASDAVSPPPLWLSVLLEKEFDIMSSENKTPDHKSDKPATAPVLPAKAPLEPVAKTDPKHASNSHEAAKPLVTPAPAKT